MSLIISIIFLYLTYRFLKWVFTTKPKEKPETAPPVSKYHDIQEVKDYKRLEKKHETYGESYETILKGTNGFLTITGGLLFFVMIAVFAVGLWPVGVVLLLILGVLGYIGEKKEKDLVTYADVKQHAEQIKALPVQQYKTDKTKTNVKGNADTGASDDARFLNYREMSALGLTSGGGVPIGHYDDYQNPLHYTDERHFITIAPNGSGKHACVQAPVLLETKNSVFIIDPKGENAAVTARFRRDGLGQKVHVLNPFGVHRCHFENIGFQSSRFNPLDVLNPASQNFAADVGSICETLIITEGKEPFFDNSARNLVSALIMYVCTTPDETATLPRVREILTSDKLLKGVLLDAEKSEFRPLAQKAGTFIKDRKAADLGINSSVLDSARTQTDFLDDTAISDNLSDSDFSFDQLKREGVTVFCVLPFNHLITHRRWFRLLVTCSMDAMTANGKGNKQVLFMLDEFPLLGHLSCIERAIGAARGSGVQVWPFLQDLSQLTDTYGKRASSFFANSGVRQYFTPNDMDTAKHISERCGEVTDIANGASYGQNMSVSESERRKPLISSHKLYGMPDNKQILFVSGNSNPLYVSKKPYFNNPKYKGRYDKNPHLRG